MHNRLTRANVGGEVLIGTEKDVGPLIHVGRSDKSCLRTEEEGRGLHERKAKTNLRNEDRVSDSMGANLHFETDLNI